MIVQQIPPATDLYQCANLVTPELAHSIATHDWLNEAVQKQEGQEQWDRWMIDKHPLIDEFERQLNAKLPLLNAAIDAEYSFAEGTRIWIDSPGFTVPMHLDGWLPAALQCYWLGDEDCGTVFYNSDDADDVRYAFKAIENTGYYMRNPNPDTNSLWHGMLVPTRNLRITSYTYFR